MPRFSRIALSFLPPVVGESLGEGRLLTAATGGSTPLLGHHGVVDSVNATGLSSPGQISLAGALQKSLVCLSISCSPSCSVFLSLRRL